MKESLVKKIADAVLYEGYLLYPYRPSALKNQQRWNFGVLAPEAYCRAQRGTESSTMRSECLLEGNNETTLNVEVRFLQLSNRQVVQAVNGCHTPIDRCGHLRFLSIGHTHFLPVPFLKANGANYQPLQEAVEREVSLPVAKPVLARGPLGMMFSFPALEVPEILRDVNSGEILGALIRTQKSLEGVVEIRIEECQSRDSEIESSETSHRVWKVIVEIHNQTLFIDADQSDREDALLHSLVSAHTILNSEHGKFVSLLDPPEQLRESANACLNLGTYPVLVGEEGARDCMLSSPIILYDYPQIAPESAGNLFDGTEIDEILTLRIMTLTDEEKREISESDHRAREILERTDNLPIEHLMKMHGAMKGLNRKS